MKYTLLALALLTLPATVAAQDSPAAAPSGKQAKKKSSSKLPIDPDSQLVTYSAVIEVPGATQDQLYTRAANWVASTATYRVASSKQLQEATDKSQLTVTGVTQARAMLAQVAGTVTHSLTIYCKDGRYKYVLTNLREETNATQTMGLIPNGMGSGGALESEQPECGFLHMSPMAWSAIKRHADEDVQNLLARLTTAMSSGTGKSPTDF
jgi:hypothetical protein